MQKAICIEKHITLSRNHRDYDWQTSLEIEDFKTFVSNVRKYEKTLGHYFKHPTYNKNLMREQMYKKYSYKGKKLEILRSTMGSHFTNIYTANMTKRKQSQQS